MQRGMEIEFVDRRDVSRKNADGQTQPTHRCKDIDPEAGVAYGQRNIHRLSYPKHFKISGNQHRSDQVIDFLMGPFHGVVKLDAALYARYHRMSAGNIKVGHGIFYGRTDDILKFCHTPPPGGRSELPILYTLTKGKAIIP